MIEVQDLKKDFGLVQALRGVSFEVERGQVVGLLGPNGAGKSTAMRIITGFLGQTSGSAKVDGLEVRDDPVATAARIGYLPEGNPLYTELRLMESLRFIAEMHGLRGADQARAIGSAIEAAGLRGMERRTIGTFSKGYRQRVGVAQALVHEPAVLVLDEPTAGLDPIQQDEMTRLIAGLSGERTVIFSTHVLPKVEAVCSRAILIHEGLKIADGTVDEIRRSGGGRPTIEMTVRAGTDPVTAFGSLAFVERVEVDAPDGDRASISIHVTEDPDDAMLEAVVRHGVEASLGVSRVRAELASLHEAFVRLVDDLPSREGNGSDPEPDLKHAVVTPAHEAPAEDA